MVVLSLAAWTRGSRALDEILADLAEARELARTLPHDPLSDVASGMRIGLLIEAFAIDEARAEIAAHRELSERAGQHFLSVVVEQHDALLALCDGRLDAAEAAAKRADELARRIEAGPSAAYGIQMFSIRREQGRLAEIAPVVRLVASGEIGTGGVVWRPALAVLLAEIGDVEEARRELRALVRAGLAAIPRGGLGVGGLTYAADACALIEDAVLAVPIYDQLRRLRGPEHGGRLRGRVLRRRRSHARRAGDGDGAVGRRRASPRERARPQPAPRLADLDRAHAVRARTAGAPPGAAAGPSGSASRRSRRWARHDASDCARSSSASNADASQPATRRGR